MSFVYDGSTLNNSKTDFVGIPVNADPNQYVQAVADWNPLATAALDLRAGIIANLFLGVATQAARPTSPPGGVSQYLWAKSSNNHLMFFNGTNDIDLSTGGGGGETLQQAYAAGGAGPQVIGLDGTGLGVFFRDNATPISGSLVAVQNNAATKTFLGVSTTGPIVTGPWDIDGGTGSHFSGKPMIKLQNTTLSTVPVPIQLSPPLVFEGHGDGAGDNRHTMGVFLRPMGLNRALVIGNSTGGDVDFFDNLLIKVTYGTESVDLYAPFGGSLGTDTIPWSQVKTDQVTVNEIIRIKEGANKWMGQDALVAGAVTVSTTAVTATSRIMLTGQNSSGAHGELTVSARTPGVSFDITSTSALDTRDVAWLIVEPA